MSLRSPSFIVILALVFAISAAAAPKTDPGKPVDFQRDVRPILSDNCFLRHGPDKGTRMADLRLDTREGAFATRSAGSVIVPTDSAASLLYQRITHENEVLRMPPTHSKKALSDEQIGVLARWIDEGASWDQHWAFESLERPDPPRVSSQISNGKWARSPLDRFVLARLEQEGLTPAPEAGKTTLARRAALDLTGLPPDPGLLENYLNDTSDSAYAKLVDKLLDSRHWGEHRARYWLDAARYGDTHGIHVDNYREMWPYRDWVINAFNDNKPFDEFTIEQIAGDLLPNPTLDQRIATGFHRCNVTTNEAGIILEEYEAIYAKDRADTTATVFLGLTVGCATCHDHKFDPISQRDFYSMTAFFRNTTQYTMDGNVSDTTPFTVVPADEDRVRWHELEQESKDLESALRGTWSAAAGDFDRWLGRGDFRTLEAPLGAEAEILALALGQGAGGEGARAILKGEVVPVDLSGGAKLAQGPREGWAALWFDKGTWAELPNVGLDEGNPFSLTVWLYMPEEEDRHVVFGQTDQDDNGRGWSMSISAFLGRLPGFHLFGDKVGESASTLEIYTGHMQQLEHGTWNHVAMTYDGSGERAGLELFVNGEVLPTQGSDYFEKLVGTIVTDQPLILGKQAAKPGEKEGELYFSGGAIADFRIFDRAINVEEAHLVSQWPLIAGAREKAPSQLSGDVRSALGLYYRNLENTDYRELQRKKEEIALERREIRRRGGVTHVMQEIAGSAAEAHILNRGMYDQPGDLVLAGTPSALHAMPASLPRNRLGLAQWLVGKENPLTSRVVVNRYWQEVFGNGLVATSDDFGSQGATPSHPELLNWLAVQFRDGGWDIKDFFRMLVTSATYRQSSRTTPEKVAKDPDNQLLSRGPRFRMDGEMVRDYALAASGLLARKVGGPSVKPYQPEGVWETVAMPGSNTSNYVQDHGDKLYRRSLYTFWKRSAPPASMDIFNAPTREHTTVRRERTNTPLQALVTMNDTQFIEASRYLAQRAMREAGDDFDRRLDFISRRLLARSFEPEERAVAKRTFDGFVSFYDANPGEATKLLSTGESQPDEALPASESAGFTMLASQILNLDEALNK